MSAVLVDEAVLFGLYEPDAMFPRDRAESASKARYLGWRILESVGYVVDTPFDPRYTKTRVCWMRRFTDDAYAELTHEFCDRSAEGAAPYWHVTVEP